MVCNKEINFIAPINFLGYGYTGLNILKALGKLGYHTSLFPLGNIEADPSDIPYIKQALVNSKRYSKCAPSIRLCHAHDLTLHVGNGPHYGWPIFELTRFTEEEKHQLKAMDGIIVCSEWAKDIVLANVSQYAQVIPLGVDTTIFNEHVNTQHNSTTTVFFNCGKWEIRKGHDILVTAFNRAFKEEDDVKLVMNCYNPFLDQVANREWELKYTRSKLGKEGKVVVNNRRLNSQYELARLIGTVDCGVFPSKAEGWNLEVLEMMAMGKHVILTNYSAHTEFASSHNSYLIDILQTEPACDNIWFNKQGEWAYFGRDQLDQLIEYMRQVHKLKQNGLLETNSEGISTSIRFTWEATAKQLIRTVLC